MADRRPLRYDNLDAIADDVRNLRAGHERCGNWTLAQACWHLKLAPEFALTPPKTTEPTPDEAKMQRLLTRMFDAGAMPPGLPIAPGTEPPADAGEAAIDGFVAALERTKAYGHSHVSFGPFGPVPIQQFRGFLLLHAANHLSCFEPTTPGRRRLGLKYADSAAMLADVRRLQRGYEKTGRWTLPQIAWHLCLAYPRPLKPLEAMPALTDAQAARQQRWDYYIAKGHPPIGFDAPAEMLPPADLGDGEVDRLIDTVRELDAVSTPVVVTAAGAMPVERARGFLLAHGAHHLSYLVPTAGTEAANA